MIYKKYMFKIYCLLFISVSLLVSCKEQVTEADKIWFQKLASNPNDFNVLDTLNERISRHGDVSGKLHLYKERAKRRERMADLIPISKIKNKTNLLDSNKLSENDFKIGLDSLRMVEDKYYTLALQDLDTVVKYDPNDLQSIWFKSSLLKRLKRYADAIEEQNKLLKIIEEYKSKGEELKEIWENGKWYNDPSYPVSRTYTPNEYDIFLERGDLYCKMGKYDLANKDFDDCLNKEHWYHKSALEHKLRCSR